MKKRLALILALAMMATTVFVGCGSKEENADADADAEKTEESTAVENDDETLVVGFDAAFPPYGYKDDNGEYVGFDLDLAQEVCDRNGWELVKQPIDWDSKDMELNSGSIDCIWNGFTINGREDDYTWTDAYLNNKQVFVVRADSGIETEADLAGKVVDVQTDSSAQVALEDNPELTGTFANLEVIPDYNTGFMNLESGAVDAVAMDIVVAGYQIESRSADFKILDYEIAAEEYGVGFAKGNEVLRDQVQKVLEEMAEDGTMAEISKKWFGEDITIIGK